MNIGREAHRREERGAENLVRRETREAVLQVVNCNIAARVGAGGVLRAVQGGAIRPVDGVTAGCHIRASSRRRSVQAFQEFGTVRVVGVDEGNPLAASLIQALVACRGNAGVLFVVEQADAGIGVTLQELANYPGGAIRGAVNHHQQLKVGVGLRQNGFNCGDDAISRVVDRHDDAGAR